ncbi:L-threonine synthase [Clostridium grantii DSM 8605]|uniref:Threonine synthase n=2 Tax=Clostridium TaxID=1485 RepID=A0A1M5XDR8_9CLOT|nr:L-threonine synthase [Clostridium grantii DSM 8605]
MGRIMNNILYKSTRGGEDNITAAEAILRGIATDGGLFVPKEIPTLKSSFEELSKMDYREVAYSVMKEFFQDYSEEELRYCINNAYDKKFDCEEIAPIVKAGDEYYLELYHGPTLAFKDMALSILPYLMTTAAKKRKMDKEIVILTATSGDTGKAALEGFSDVEGTRIIVFFPQEGVSEVQRMQMITHKGDNTSVVGIKGNFDDAQTAVKNIFTSKEFNDLLNDNGFAFSSANSINIGRLVPQVAYYVYTYATLLKNGEIKEGEKINVVVPTGNFGNILAAYYAKQMGTPIDKLICASNDNKVLYDFMSTGEYDKERKFFTTISPSMDILISSNLERLLYIISGNSSETVATLMNDLKEKGSYKITEEMKESLKDFFGGYADEEKTLNSVKKVFQKKNYLMDTHTAVAHAVYEEYLKETKDTNKAVIISTASPYKFTAPVMKAVDKKYEGVDDFELVKEMEKLTSIAIPEGIKDLEKREILHTRICAKEAINEEVMDILNFK